MQRAGRVATFLAIAACSGGGKAEPPSEPGVATPDWGPPDELGGWNVGVQTLDVADPRGGTLAVEVWYPAGSDGDPPGYDLPYSVESRAFRDARPIGVGHPLVLFSHGNGGSRLQSIFLTEHLASHGFVVASVDHPNNTVFDYDDDALPVVAARRPDDVRNVLDALVSASAEPDHWLFERLDAERVGIVGHSFGAWTSLVLGGGLLDLEAGEAYCAAEDPPGCGIVGAVALEGPPPAPDPRIGVTVLLAPGGWYSFSDLTGVAPALVVSGSRDGDLPFDEEQRPTFDRLGSPRALMVLRDGGHFGFTDACALVPIADCAGAADGYMEPLRMQGLTKTAVTAFMGLRLAAEDASAPWMTPDPWPADEVTWTAEP